MHSTAAKSLVSIDIHILGKRAGTTIRAVLYICEMQKPNQEHSITPMCRFTVCNMLSCARARVFPLGSAAAKASRQQHLWICADDTAAAIADATVKTGPHLDSLVLMRNWLETPGWSTSWIALAKMAARISRSVNTAWKGRKKRSRHGWRDGGWGGQKYPCELEPLIGGLEAGGTVIEADCGRKRFFFVFFRAAYVWCTCESVRRTHLEGGGG